MEDSEDATPGGLQLLLLPLLKLLETERARMSEIKLRKQEVEDFLGACEGLVGRQKGLAIPRLLDRF